MFSKLSLAALTALLSVASAVTVDITREACTGPKCQAYLLNLPLNGNTTINKPASALYLTGVSNPGGGVIDVHKIECSLGYKGQTNPDLVLTNKTPLNLSANSVEVDWILCTFNRANPGKL